MRESSFGNKSIVEKPRELSDEITFFPFSGEKGVSDVVRHFFYTALKKESPRESEGNNRIGIHAIYSLYE